MRKVSVALVNMPFAALNLPSIGLSLLRAAIERDGHRADLFYLNLHFAEMVGVDPYSRVAETPTILLLGEWVFSDALAGEAADREHKERFLPQFVDRGITAETLGDLPGVTAQVEPFLDACLRKVPWDQYDLIGFSSVFTQNAASLALARRLKELYPGKLIALGGANVEGVMGRAVLKAFPFVDLVCSGEGDVAFPELIRRFAEGEPLSGIPGITLRTDSYSLVPCANAQVCDIDSLPYPDYDDYFRQLAEHGLYDALKPKLRILFESSRGCWWGAKSHCTFCGLNGSELTYRSKSPPRALAELRFLAEKYQGHTRSVSAVDNIIGMKYFHDFLPGVRELGLDLFYETKANLTKAQVQALAEAGVRDIQPGIESLSSSVLRLMHKGTTMLQNVQVLKWCREYGVKANWNHLYGFPQEDQAEYDRIVREVLPAISHLDPPYGGFPLRLDRFSPIFDDPGAHGIENMRPHAGYRRVYPQLPDSIRSALAYYFEFDYRGGERPQEYSSALRTAVAAWRNAEGSELFSTPIDESLVIFDLRPDARSAMHRLTGLQRLVYQHCDAIRSRESVRSYLDAQGYHISRVELSGFIEPLLHSLLMLAEGENLLSLALPLGVFSPGLAGARRFLAFLDQQSRACGTGSDPEVVVPVSVSQPV